jgi:hypothetical protein
MSIGSNHEFKIILVGVGAQYGVLLIYCVPLNFTEFYVISCFRIQVSYGL